MPLYEYLCEACGRRLEEMQRLAEPPLTTCPHCGGKLRKLLSAPAFQFKGSGWYLTDYARKGGKTADGGGEKGGGEKGGGEKGGDAGSGASTDKSGGGDKSAADSKPSKPSSGD